MIKFNEHVSYFYASITGGTKWWHQVDREVVKNKYGLPTGVRFAMVSVPVPLLDRLIPNRMPSTMLVVVPHNN